MSGLLSGIFNGGSDARSEDDSPLPSIDGLNGQDPSVHGDTASLGAHAAQGVELEPHVGVSTGGSYTGSDGQTATWTHSDDVSAHGDVDAALSSIVAATADTAAT